MLLIDKFLTVPQKALFYVRQTVANGWSRNVLHNFIDSSLYERQGKALSNFNRTLSDVDSDLVQEIQKTHTILRLQALPSHIMSVFSKMLCSTTSPSS